MDKQSQVKEVSERLRKLYPDAHVELNYTNPFELLVASILAAQNTDKNVNKVTATLFRKYRGPADFVAAAPEEVEQDIHSLAIWTMVESPPQLCATGDAAFDNRQWRPGNASGMSLRLAVQSLLL